MKRTSFILLFAVAASAAHAYDLGTANNFNAFIFGNVMTNGGHADGAVALSGNWTGSGYDTLQGNYGASYGGYTNIGMYAGGSVSYTNNGSLNNSGTGHVAGSFSSQNTYNVNGGTLYIGGTKSGSVNGNVQTGTNTVDAGLFTTQKAFSISQSNAIKSLGGTAIDTSNQNNWAINAASQAGTQKVFSIAGSALSNLRTLDISGIGSNDTVLINVTGATMGGFGVTVNTNTGKYNQLLWNFADATTLNISDRAFHGSILAPNAVVSQSQNIDGNLVASGWNNYNSAEIHFGSSNRFSGAAPVPEPTALAIFGFGFVGMAIKKRKAAKQAS